MVTDGKNPQSELTDPLLDLPPSYDLVTEAAGSSSSAPPPPPPSAPRAPPKETLLFFQQPELAESLFGRKTTPEETLNSIKTIKKGKILVSSDRRLQNPNVLYDWIRQQALVPPKLIIRCLGAHYNVPERDGTVQDRDGVRQQRKGQPERIVDFDFTIDLSNVYAHPENLANVHLCTVRPDFATARGTLNDTYAATYAPVAQTEDYTPLLGATDPGRGIESTKASLAKDWQKWQAERGLPSWKTMEDYPEFLEDRGKGKSSAPIALPSSPDLERDASPVTDGQAPKATLQEWCQKYASDPRLLKSFEIPSYVWGWNFKALATAVEGAVKSTGYTSNELKVTFEVDQTTTVVLPPNLLSRAINTTWSYVLLWMTLLYPLIWLWQRLHPAAGGPYRVSAVARGMKFYPPLPSTFPNETLESASDRLGGMYKIHSELPKPAQLAYGPQGVHYLLGRKEGEWFREWEERIRMGVRMRYRGALEGGGEEEAGAGLDGY